MCRAFAGRQGLERWKGHIFLAIHDPRSRPRFAKKKPARTCVRAGSSWSRPVARRQAAMLSSALFSVALGRITAVVLATSGR